MSTVKINFWRTIALAFVCQQVEQATAMTMLGPSRKEVGLNLVQTNSEALQVVSPAVALSQVAEAPDDDPCHNQLTAIFDDQKVQSEPADVMLKFMQDYCVEAADDFLPKIVTPYFCFYTGSILVSQIKEQVVKPPKTNEKKQIISEYCAAMDSKAFAARKNMIDRTIHGKPCIEAYDATYSNPAAVKYDPISRAISSRAMCGEFVKEINELLEMNKSNVANATRYSYLISQQVDLQTQLIDTYSSCVSSDAEAKPRETCINIMLQPTFDLYSTNDKAQVCQVAVRSWNDLKTDAEGSGDKKPDVCAVLTSHIFQSYSDHLQDLSDAILGALTESLSKKLQESSADYQQQKQEQQVKIALKQAKGDKIVKDGQKLVNDIQLANYQNQLKNEQDAQKQAKDKQQEDLMNIQVVQNNLGSLKDAGSQNQKSPEEAKKKVMDSNVEKVNTTLTQLQADQQLDIQAVSNFLGGLQAAQTNSAPIPAPQQPQLAQVQAQPQQQMQMQQPQQMAQTYFPQTQVQQLPQQQQMAQQAVYQQQTPQQLMQTQSYQVMQQPQQQFNNFAQTAAQPQQAFVPSNNMQFAQTQAQAQPQQQMQQMAQMQPVLAQTQQPVFQQQPMQLAQTQMQQMQQPKPQQLVQVGSAQQQGYNTGNWLTPVTNLFGF